LFVQSFFSSEVKFSAFSLYHVDKLENNKRRDFQNKRKLKKLGWRVIDVWECTLKKKNLEKTFNRLERLIAA